MLQYILMINNKEHSRSYNKQDLLDTVAFGYGDLIAEKVAKKGFFLLRQIFIVIKEAEEV